MKTPDITVIRKEHRESFLKLRKEYLRLCKPITLKIVTKVRLVWEYDEEVTLEDSSLDALAKLTNNSRFVKAHNKKIRSFLRRAEKWGVRYCGNEFFFFDVIEVLSEGKRRVKFK